MMNAHTGKKMDELEHIEQCIEKILTTAVGTRVMRRNYGSVIPELIDQPLNSATVLRIISASATAIARWEKRVILKAMQLRIVNNRVMADIEFLRKGQIHQSQIMVMP